MRTFKKAGANPAIMLAISKVGTSYALANLLGCTQGNIMHLLYRHVPAKRAKQIEELLGIPREDLNPNLFKK